MTIRYTICCFWVWGERKLGIILVVFVIRGGWVIGNGVRWVDDGVGFGRGYEVEFLSLCKDESAYTLAEKLA